jgi:hypothetical protein
MYMFSLNEKRKKIVPPKYQEEVTTTLNLKTAKVKQTRNDLTKEQRDKIKKERKLKNSDFFEIKKKEKKK